MIPNNDWGILLDGFCYCYSGDCHLRIPAHIDSKRPNCNLTRKVFIYITRTKFLQSRGIRVSWEGRSVTDWQRQRTTRRGNTLHSRSKRRYWRRKNKRNLKLPAPRRLKNSPRAVIQKRNSRVYIRLCKQKNVFYCFNVQSIQMLFSSRAARIVARLVWTCQQLK